MPATPNPILLPLGDAGLLVRFGATLSDAANRRAVGFARRLSAGAAPMGVVEIVPNLVSVLLRYDPRRVGYDALAGELRLLLGADEPTATAATHAIPVQFDGEDLDAVATTLGLSREAFIQAHSAAPLRVIATGFAPGFVYCGFHAETLIVPRRDAVRPQVPAGTVLFAAGQTAIAATPIPTGWHIIGHTTFRNFDPAATPPTTLAAGDRIRFEVAR